MKRINRRSVTAAMGGLGVLAWLGGEREAGKGAAPLDHRFNLESIKVYAHWQRSEPLAPAAYLASLGLELGDSAAIKRQVQRDFETDNLYIYDGLVASKCEMAVVAHYGMELGALTS